MVERSKKVNEEIVVDLKLKVNINSFYSHFGFKEGQTEQAIEEFKGQIKDELENKVLGIFNEQEFLCSVDSTDYDVSL